MNRLDPTHGSERTTNKSQPVEEKLRSIVHAVVLTLPEVDYAGSSIRHRDGTIETMAGTGQLLWRLAEVLYQLMEGPCVDGTTQCLARMP